MAKYYILSKAISTGATELVETIEAKGLKEARKIASSKHINIITSGTHQLIVVGKAGYTQYYKEA